MPTDPRNLGPDGKNADVSGEHLDQATACLSTATARRDVQDVAQAIANAEARGLHAIDRPRGRELDHNTTAHRLVRDLAGPIREDGPTEDEREQAEQTARAALADAYAAGRADQLAEQTGPGLALTVEQLAEVRRLFGSMPYGGSLSGGRRFGQTPADGPELVEILRKLPKLLAILGEQETRRSTELDQLRRQREAFREYAGAGLLGLLAVAKTDAPNPLELAHRAESLPVGSTGPHLASLIEEEAHRLGYASVSEFLQAPGRIDLLERHARERAALLARQADERAGADIRPEEEAAALDADQRAADETDDLAEGGNLPDWERAWIARTNAGRDAAAAEIARAVDRGDEAAEAYWTRRLATLDGQIAQAQANGVGTT